ncbi:MAG: L-threonylcarbamoyladenylate synthase [Candidatus Berkiellales bacterium]
MLSILQGATCLRQGKVIAYPTEAVFGLGCCPQNPTALTKLLQLKQRDPTKGLLLIASDIAQILPYIDRSTLSAAQWDRIEQSWPGPYTWVFPATQKVLPLIRGQFDSVAVRVTAHPIASALAKAFEGPLVSTSANRSSQSPFQTAEEIIDAFGESIAGVVEGSLGGEGKPTTIQDALTGQIYREGKS